MSVNDDDRELIYNAQLQRIAGRKTLQARWYGALPAIGDYLMSTRRPRGAYKIIAIRERNKDVVDTVAQLFQSDFSSLELTCEAVAVADVPVGATVHDWQWNSRDRKGAVWR